MACIPEFEYAINGRCVVVLETLTLNQGSLIGRPCAQTVPNRGQKGDTGIISSGYIS